MNDHLVVLVTAKDKAEARRIATSLFEKKLVACVNFVPLESMFMWEGELQEEEEVLMVIKTRAVAFDDVVTTVKAAHSYDTPEIIALPILRGSHEYLKWIEHVVKV